MKKFTSIAIAFLLALSVVPAMAADQTNSIMESTTSQAVDKVPATFQAFSNLSATEREALAPLTDTELAAIEGAVFDCIVCTNLADVDQANVAIQGAATVIGDATNAALQSNAAAVLQSNN